MRTPAQNAELALLLEVAGTPKPGNVDRHRDFDDLRFEHFLAGAVGASEGLRAAEGGGGVGDAFETAVAGMADQRGGNTQFGALLLLVPLVRAAGEDALTPAGVESVVADTTVADAAGFYRAFDHVDVFVDDPPADADDLDARRGSDAIPAVEERGLTLSDLMELSAPEDDNAVEWTTGFPRTFAVAESVAAGTGPVPDRIADAFLAQLAEHPDSLVAKQHGREVADEVASRAAALLDDEAPAEAVDAFGDDLVERGVNPGTTADIVAAGTFVALERDEVVV
ncbi:triphosphoribosyl-dephospho-CoA synthase [Haloarchaeobius amylolyticus]|uniref:triphosphoribosyl-dephospho-CoA synthase n=1 Tax=Haloarchaeobius amylolyticus TaxID=1198296 RepID=UPI00226F9A4A|nr:triphosphoribosyl-dephospho-CoA synthase [Haloarchaeobius amylolyticus]